MEFWDFEMPREIVAEANKSVVADEFTNRYRKIGFAWFYVEFDVGGALEVGSLYTRIWENLLADFYL